MRIVSFCLNRHLAMTMVCPKEGNILRLSKLIQSERIPGYFYTKRNKKDKRRRRMKNRTRQRRRHREGERRKRQIECEHRRWWKLRDRRCDRNRRTISRMAARIFMWIDVENRCELKYRHQLSYSRYQYTSIGEFSHYDTRYKRIFLFPFFPFYFVRSMVVWVLSSWSSRHSTHGSWCDVYGLRYSRAILSGSHCEEATVQHEHIKHITHYVKLE